MSENTELLAFRERHRAASEKMVPLAFARARWSAAEITALQTERLRALIAHAAERSPFYAHRLRGLDLQRFELADLPRVAPLAKSEGMAQLDALFTDRRLSCALAEDALAATAKEPVPLFGRYLAQATGGSSGERGVFVCEAETWAEVSAGAIRELVAAAPGARTIAMVAAPSPVHSTGPRAGAPSAREPDRDPLRARHPALRGDRGAAGRSPAPAAGRLPERAGAARSRAEEGRSRDRAAEHRHATADCAPPSRDAPTSRCAGVRSRSIPW